MLDLMSADSIIIISIILLIILTALSFGYFVLFVAGL